MKGGPKDIVTFQIFDNAILDFLIISFFFKRAEHLVPNDENSGIISVEISGIGRMVDAVMGWGVHYCFKPAWHPVNRFGMDPILVKQIYPANKGNHRWVKADQEHRQGKYPR